jgi:predicted enzyme related to lactoylglutathione lyase
MTHQPNFFILYVADPQASAAFYARLFGRTAIEASPTFAMFALDSGVMLGLWKRDTVEPSVQAQAGGSEVAFSLENDQIVNDTHQRWAGQGVPMLQAPTRMDFGYTFCAVDPDGHRLRAFAAGA